MKIQKGHYVPKELITSEAIHEAVVKCFVEAGFSDKRPNFGKNGRACEGDDGLGICNRHGKPFIMWGIKGCSVDEPLTLQQLFTAENSIAWPDFAISSQANDTAVWFDDGKQPKEQFKLISSVKSHWNTANGVILAAHQPKEKEVNEVLDKAVIKFCGVWPEFEWKESKQNKHAIVRTIKQWKHDEENRTYRVGNIGKGGTLFDPEYVELVCTKDQFTQRAKELGFINGYRYGVEYATNGIKPDLDGVGIEILNNSWKPARLCEEWNWALKNTVSAIVKFRIVDQRYKPRDTSYLNASSQDQSLTHKSAAKTISLISTTWWDYENQRALRLPDIGEKVLFNCGQTYFVVAHHCNRNDVVIGSEFESLGELKYLAVIKCKPLDHATRKAELEKSKFIQSALDSFSEVKSDYPPASNKWLEKLFGELFDAGFKAPDQK